MPETKTFNPRVRDSETRLTAAALKARGWTNTLIRDLLGAPDHLCTNPHHRSGPPMRLYNIGRVEAAEMSAAWVSRTEAVRRRKEAAARAVETKRGHLLSQLGTLEIMVPVWEANALTEHACANYNQRQFNRASFHCLATPESDIAFLRRISVNFVRHCLSDYEAELMSIFGRVGVRDGYRKVNRRVYAAIANAYPFLADECQRQLYGKFDGQ